MPSRRSPSSIAPKPRSAEIRLAARFDDQKPIWRTSYHHGLRSGCGDAEQRSGERAELDGGRGGEAGVRLDSPRSGRWRGRAPRSRRRRSPVRRPRRAGARASDRAGAARWPTEALGQRCERAGAAKAVVAVERLGASDLRPAARQQVGAQRAPLRGDRPRGHDGLDEVTSRVVPGLSAVGRVRVVGLHARGETAPSRRAERRRRPPRRRVGAARAGSRFAPCARCTVRVVQPRARRRLLRRRSRWNT